jgi:hypothetical protein
MDNNTEMDPFKDNIRSKIKDVPTESSNDQKLWEDVLWELDTQNRLYRLHQGWYAMAASVLLFISVGAGILVYNYSEKENIGKQLSYNSNPQKSTSTKVDKAADKVIVAEQSIASRTDSKTEKGVVIKKQEAIPVLPTQQAEIIQSGEKTTSHTLTDGSSIALHEGAQISVAESFNDNRKIILNGEAYFEVAKDPNHPFEVFFDKYSLKVLGTKFNIRNIKGEDEKEVTVTEGIVKVFYNSKEAMVLTKGQQLKLVEGKAPELINVDPNNYIAWKTGQLEFKKTNLEEVMSLLSRFHKVEIRLAPEIKNCKFTGDLSGLSLNDGLDIIKMSTSVNVEKSNGKIILSGKGCE